MPNKPPYGAIEDNSFFSFVAWDYAGVTFPNREGGFYVKGLIYVFSDEKNGLFYALAWKMDTGAGFLEKS